MEVPFKSNYPQIARESGFRLRQFKDGPLDWKLVGSMEVDRILREQQFEHIDAILLHLSEAPLAFMLDSNVLDSGVAKYFTLSQLALQYMIFCRKFLDESVRTLRDNIIKLESQNRNLKTINQEHTENILHLHKKLSQVESIPEIVFPCHVCTKNFVNNDALNIHLSKKHFNNTSINIQGKEKDQTLINTIKLELEIKQLKERLNIAEKDIRETSEYKNTSPRQITHSRSQIEVQTRNFGTQRSFDKTKVNSSLVSTNVGTQCNLFESKELDSNDDAKKEINSNDDQGNKIDILFEIQEKISMFEALQNTYSSGNQQSINEIKSKLSDITEFLETQTRLKAENVTSKSYKILPSTSVEELQGILSNMFNEVSQMNFERTTQIINKIERNYEQKLYALEIENQNGKKKKLSQQIQTLGTELSPNIDSTKQMGKQINDNVYPSPLSRTTSSIEDISELHSDSCSSTNKSKVESQEKKRRIVRKEKILDDEEAFHKLQNRMALCGLNINSKSISATEAANISGCLIEQRNTFKQVYPRFYKTRSRLNKLVELLISEKKSYRDGLKKQKQGRKQTETDITKQKNESPKQIDGRIASTKFIERILTSPIKQPRSYVSRYNKDEIKPIPMPRKHVMFHSENEESTDVESSLKYKIIVEK